jgi:hypothetical protein
VAGATGTFLLVDFLIVAGHFATGFGMCGTGATVGTIRRDEVVNSLGAFIGGREEHVCGLGGFYGKSLGRHDVK